MNKHQLAIVIVVAIAVIIGAFIILNQNNDSAIAGEAVATKSNVNKNIIDSSQGSRAARNLITQGAYIVGEMPRSLNCPPGNFEHATDRKGRELRNACVLSGSTDQVAGWSYVGFKRPITNAQGIRLDIENNNEGCSGKTCFRPALTYVYVTNNFDNVNTDGQQK